MSYGYTREVLLPVRITPPASLRPGDPFRLHAAAAWLVCERECIPEEATLTLPVTTGPPLADPRWGPVIARVRTAWGSFRRVVRFLPVSHFHLAFRVPVKSG
jgi:thiol:disulfide interchange protein DsbD